MTIQRSQVLLAGSMVLVLLLVLSGIRPFDRATWALEIFPILIALPLLWATYRRFPLTNLLYFLIFCHAVVLMLGGAYSYARVPLGFQIADLLHLSRNPYDKIGHFFQGFVPALVAREIFIRGHYVRAGKMLGFLVICVVLAISAAYELIEWAAAVWLGQGADEFLGTQGDPWDTQSDMFLALIGGVTAIWALSRVHDKQLMKVMAMTSQAKHSLPEALRDDAAQRR
jgi:putative membrane protein